MFNVLNYNQA